LRKPGAISGDGIFKLLRSPPAYVSWRAGTTTLFLLSSYLPYIVLKFQHSTVLFPYPPGGEASTYVLRKCPAGQSKVFRRTVQDCTLLAVQDLVYVGRPAMD
jgi:hypothetical protein